MWLARQGCQSLGITVVKSKLVISSTYRYLPTYPNSNRITCVYVFLQKVQVARCLYYYAS